MRNMEKKAMALHDPNIKYSFGITHPVRGIGSLISAICSEAGSASPLVSAYKILTRFAEIAMRWL